MTGGGVRWVMLRACAAGLLLACVLDARAGALDVLPADPPALEAAELYLEVSINGVKTGLVAPFHQTPQGLRSSVQNLLDLGLEPERFGVGGQDAFILDAIPDLEYRYDAAAQSIDLRLGDTLRRPLQLSARNARQGGAGSADPGMLLNYDLYGTLGPQRRLAALNEFRWFGPRGVLSSSGNAVLRGGGQGGDAGRRYIRYDTAWTWSDPATLQTLQVGDFISPSLNWTRSLRMAGVEWRRNFELRPDLLTYPLASIGASAVVPGSVSLYVNGIQQYSAEVPGGPFVIDQVAGLNGAGQATVVTRDALGRVVATSLPLYVDTRLLSGGLSDFAVSAGMLRRDYGIRSFRYAGSPALTGSLRHGVSDALTVEAHAEAGRGLLNGGAGALVRLGTAGGVLSGALAASGGKAANGAQASVAYQYIAPRFAIDLESVRATLGYADLGTAEGSPVIRVNDRASVNLSLEHAGSASLSLVHYRAPLSNPVRLVALAWSRSVGYGAFLNLSAYQDLGKPETRGLGATLSVSLGSRVALSATGGRQGGQRTRTLSVSRTADVDGGWGWGVQKGGIGGLDVAQAQVQYLGSAGQLSTTTVQAGAARSTSIGLSGSLVAMDGTIIAARHVGRGFAMVSTGLAGVPVHQENRVIGRTGTDGRLLVPDLMPYASNMIAIDTSNLPADARVARSSQDVVPRSGAGVLVPFSVERYRAATVIVQDAGGKPLAVGTPARLAGASGDSAATVVGYDGVVFLDGLQPSNDLVLGEGAATCSLHFDYQPGAEGQLPVIGPLRCPVRKETP